MPVGCEGWHSLASEIQAATSVNDLNRRISKWPGGFFTGRGATEEQAKTAAQNDARDSVETWCQGRPACGNGKECHEANFRFRVAYAHSDALNEEVAYLTVTRIQCECRQKKKKT